MLPNAAVDPGTLIVRSEVRVMDKTRRYVPASLRVSDARVKVFLLALQLEPFPSMRSLVSFPTLRRWENRREAKWRIDSRRSTHALSGIVGALGEFRSGCGPTILTERQYL